MKKTLQYISIGLIFLISCQDKTGFSGFQNGDIIFQTSKSGQSRAIQIATGSNYSHMGIVYKQENEFFVYEAVQPVKLTPLNDWINRGKNAHYVVKRIKNSEKLLTPEALTKMKQVGEKYAGKDYDLYFEWSDSRIYCSELVWKIYKEAVGLEIGELEELSDFNLTNETVKQKLMERYGDNIPKEELVISPESMFNSDKLITIFEN
ncbi:YiiX family permuted papain-like enzyme [Marivirga tractuosa]|uniref:YiiX family permuted papain-like enzyme n=1 Tax=Marivirga tractuosa TaxID=1006 RepID=UPI0035CF381B